MNNEILIDKRGTHENRSNKISDIVWDELKKFIETFPTQISHYRSNEISQKYFQNTNLNLKKIHKSFINFYFDKYRTNLKLSYTTFVKHYNFHINIGFKHPRSDLCDFHFRIEQIVY